MGVRHARGGAGRGWSRCAGARSQAHARGTPAATPVPTGRSDHAVHGSDESAPCPRAERSRRSSVCTRWHCSVPGATWPNRNCAGAGDVRRDRRHRDRLLRGRHDLRPARGQRRHFARLPRQHRAGDRVPPPAGRRWRRTGTASTTSPAPRRVGCAPPLLVHRAVSRRPARTASTPGNNDFDSAPTTAGARFDFARGDDLIASIYGTLRAHPEVFAKTVFLVTYDEHGGLYDHVSRRPGPAHRSRWAVWSDRRCTCGSCRSSGSSRARGSGSTGTGPASRPSSCRPGSSPPPSTARCTTTRASRRPCVRSSRRTPRRFCPRREARAATFEHLLTGPLRTDLPDLASLPAPRRPHRRRPPPWHRSRRRSGHTATTHAPARRAGRAPRPPARRAHGTAARRTRCARCAR